MCRAVCNGTSELGARGFTKLVDSLVAIAAEHGEGTIHMILRVAQEGVLRQGAVALPSGKGECPARMASSRCSTLKPR